MKKNKSTQKISPMLVQAPKTIKRSSEKGEATNPMKFHPTKRPEGVETSRGKFGFK